VDATPEVGAPREPESPEESANAPRCVICFARRRDNARFCAACGAPQSSEAQAEHRAQVPDLARHLTIAGAAFALPLATSLVLMIVGVRDVGWLRLSEGVCLIVGAGGLAALGAPARAGLQLPHGLTLRGVALTIAGTLAALCAAACLSALWPLTTGDAIVQLYLEAGHGLGTALFDFSVLAPIAEELAFRGVLLIALVSVLGETGAVWTSALLFATLHLSPISFAHLVLLGVVFARLRLATGSLYPGMLVHGVYNAIITLYDWRGESL